MKQSYKPKEEKALIEPKFIVGFGIGFGLGVVITIFVIVLIRSGA